MTGTEAQPDAVDRLIAARPELANSAIAGWEGRSASPFLKALAKLHELCPEACAERGVWGEGEPGEEPSLLEYVGSVSNWAFEAKTTPIRQGEEIDRTASMLGGAPWTCDSYPWPMGREARRPMSPLVQLNLATLDLPGLGPFPPVLVQVWGDAYMAETRVIPLSAVSGLQPAPLHAGQEDANLVSPSAFLPDMGNRNLFYDGRCDVYPYRDQAGDYLSVGRREFHLIGNPVNFFYFHLEDLKGPDPVRLPRIEVAMQEVAKLAYQLSDRERDAFKGAHFGGGQSPIQRDYDPWNGTGRALFEISSGEKGPSLSILGSGRLQVTHDPRDPWEGYEAFASV